MILARFGNETDSYEYFYVNSKKGIHTISDLSFSYGKDVETQGTTGYKPISYITALKLVKGGFKIHLDHRFVDVKEKIDKWQAWSENNHLYGFSIGNKFISKNKFVVLEAKVSNTKINGKGKYLSADLDITIEEYAGKNKNIGILRKRLEDYS